MSLTPLLIGFNLQRAYFVEGMLSFTNKAEKMYNPDFIVQDFLNACVQEANVRLARGRLRNFLSVETLYRMAASLCDVVYPVPIQPIYISDNDSSGTPDLPHHSDLAIPAIRGRLSVIDDTILINTGRKIKDTIYIDIPSQNPIWGARLLQQTAKHELPLFGRVYLLNVAPRKKESGKHDNNKGEDVWIGVHPKTAAVVIGVGEHCFSMFKDDIVSGEMKVFRANVETAVSQFRSRDFFPWLIMASAYHIPKNTRFAGKPLSPDDQMAFFKGWKFVDQKTTINPSLIPDLHHIVTSVDNHGNMETTIKSNDVKKHLDGAEGLLVYSNGDVCRALRSNAPFAKNAGNLVVSFGSKGRNPFDLANDNDVYVEVFEVNGRAADKFNLTSSNLRQGVEVCLIDERLFKQVREVFPQRSDKELARAIVDAELVAGANNTALHKAIEAGRLRDEIVFDRPTVAEHCRQIVLAANRRLRCAFGA